MTGAAPASFSPRSRMLLWSAAAGAAVLLALCAWYFLVLRQDFAALYRDLRPSEASAIVAELEKQGIRYRLGGGGTQILVPAGQLDATRVKLASTDIAQAGQEGFELFDASDLGLTEFAQKIRYQRAMQGELARTIMMMDGVAEARVHLSLPERGLFRNERRSAEAAVTLIMRPPLEATAERIDGVQRLVAASVPDLSIGDVVVLNARGEVLSAIVDATSASERRYSPAAGAMPSVDAALAVIHRVIPDRAFDVAVEPTPPDLVGGEGDTLDRAPFVIHFKSATPLGSTASEAVVAALREAGMIDGTSGGSIVFDTDIAEPPLSAAAHAEPQGNGAEPSATTPAPIATMLAWTIALLGLGLLLWRRVLGPRLSRDERVQFATLVKSTLQTHQGSGHA